MSTNDLMDAIKNTLTKLLNQRIQEIGRAANMLWIAFGEPITCINIKGKPVIKSEFALHIQCNWAIMDDYQILLSDDDFYIPRDGVSSQLFEMEQFGNSRFDEVSVKLNATFKAGSVNVAHLDINVSGGFCLELSNHSMIKVCPYNPLEGESWRFLMPGSDEEHFVVFEE